MTLASRPIPSSNRNPCPVCESITGDCRTLADEAEELKTINSTTSLLSKMQCGASETAEDIKIDSSASEQQQQEEIPDWIDENHWKEFRSSAIDPEIIGLNFKSIAPGNDAYSYILHSEKLQRHNNGRLSDKTLKKYSHLANGGWWGEGVNVLTGEDWNLFGSFKPNTPTNDLKAKASIVKSGIKPISAIYCDGSGTQDLPGGWGVVIVFANGEWQEFGGYCATPTTNQRMELESAIASCQYLAKLGIRYKVSIYSDSEYVVQGISSWVWAWRKNGWVTKEGNAVVNRDQWEKLLNLVQALNVEFVHVKGHAGNERANKVARWCWKNAKHFGECPFDRNSININEVIKPRKYEHPPKYKLDIFALKVPSFIWERISRRYEVDLPENYKHLSYAAFWQWVKENPKITIIITEGIKKAACILSYGYVAIALPGITTGIRKILDEEGEDTGKKELIPQLQFFAQPGRRFYFAFDQDTKRNTVRNVNKAIKSTSYQLFTYKCEIRVMNWLPVLGKGIDDVVAASGENSLHEIYKNALSFDEWQTQESKQLSYTPNLIINQQYLLDSNNPQATTPPMDAQLIGLLAPKGTGKTHWFAHLVKPLVESGERKVILLTHLIQLGLQTAKRCGIHSINEGLSMSHYQNSIALCINSLLETSQAAFDPDEWKGAYLIIDEVEQVIWSLLSSPTVKKDRIKIIKNLKKLIENIINYGGKIIIADADLRDTSIDFIKGLLGREIDTWILKNEYKPEPCEIFHFTDKQPTRMLKLLENGLRKGKKYLLLVSAQRQRSKTSTHNLEKYFSKIEGIRILRVDSKTVQNPEAEAFNCTANINEIFVDYSLVIASPTLQTGVSIDVEHFDGVFAIFQGVQTTDACRQFLARYRPNVPRFIWIKPKGFNTIGSGATTARALLAAENQKDKAHLKRLSEAGFNTNFDGSIDAICLETWAKMAAVINSGMKNYQEEIIADLEKEGHIIHRIAPGDKTIFLGEDGDEEIDIPDQSQADALKDSIESIKEVEYDKYCNSVPKTMSLTDRQYEELKRKGQKTTEEQLTEIKGDLERKYGIEVTPELVRRDDEKWYSKIKTHYYLSDGSNYLEFRDNENFIKQVQKGEGAYLKTDSNKSMWWLRIATAKALKILQLIELEEISNNHPLAQEIFNYVHAENPKTGRKDNIIAIKTYLGIDLSKAKTPMIVCQSLMEIIGFRYPKLKMARNGDQRDIIYGKPAPGFEEIETISDRGKSKRSLKLDSDGKPIPISDDREKVFEAWLKRDTEAFMKSELTDEVEPETIVNTESVAQKEAIADTPQNLQTINPTQKRCFAWHYSQWKEAIIQHWEERTEQKFFKAVVNFLDGGSCTIWRRDFLEVVA
ncbi:plasmid replication protein, CyRepA1 family [Fischerella thermalis]|uniref:Uncharacterized protein n=1 Tax=Fischerella thermalis CCMEE 5318 TaxID=2019666 RepID=A0A2N6LPM3_9CYAN|nr:plasmid replication protein, CyRepA1 family [Fischerella thermalis]PMB27800.1 hypothetical protein CEN46_00685 [Fischerella thermalis CCMEE 5318]